MARRKPVKTVKQVAVGRPEFGPSPEQRRMVELMAGEATEEVIAKLVGVSSKTLRKHFAAELELGRARVLADNLRRLDDAAEAGNVAAAKALAARKDILPQPQPSKETVLGKKAEAEAAAQAEPEEAEWARVVH